MRFISAKYPELNIPTVGVRFREGVADVTTRGAIAYLQTAPMRRRGVRRADEPDVEVPPAGQPVQVAEPAPLHIPEPEPEQEAAAPSTDLEVPDGSAADVLAWVNDDPARAEAALAAEHSSDKPRATLITKLGKIGG